MFWNVNLTNFNSKKKVTYKLQIEIICNDQRKKSQKITSNKMVDKLSTFCSFKSLYIFKKELNTFFHFKYSL